MMMEAHQPPGVRTRLMTAANPTRSCASAGNLAGSAPVGRCVSQQNTVEDVACALEAVL